MDSLHPTIHFAVFTESEELKALELAVLWMLQNVFEVWKDTVYGSDVLVNDEGQEGTSCASSAGSRFRSLE